MELARQFRIPYRLLRKNMSSREFLMHAIDLDMQKEAEEKKRLEEHEKWEYYAARIAYEVYLSRPSKSRKLLKESDFLYKYKTSKKRKAPKKPEPVSEEQARINLALRKFAILRSFGIDPGIMSNGSDSTKSN